MSSSTSHSKPLSPLIKQLSSGSDDSAPYLDTIDISGIAYDSRKVKRGDAFFCIEGEKQDGNAFIGDAVGKGASCIFTERSDVAAQKVPVVHVTDVRSALAQTANYLFDTPSKRLRLLGVTGTNGKTTTTHLIERILEFTEMKVGLIGTLGSRWTGRPYQDAKHTTPQASDLQELLNTMTQDAVTHVAMEVSSHALALKRVEGCHFSCAVLTNITQDHLDFHKTMDSYWRAKRLLFEQLVESEQRDLSAVLNIDDPLFSEFERVVRGTKVKKLTYGFSKSADITAESLDFSFAGTSMTLKTPEGTANVKMHLNGPFNVYNTMAAVGVCLAEGVELSTCVECLESFPGVSGRFEVVSASSGDTKLQEPLCIVDYAHTPDGLENVLNAARTLVPQDGRLIAVFGCGGDRDSSKRPQMGEIAENRADVIFVTSDNPRTEDPQQIIADILAGIRRLKSVHVEPDRASAIRQAVSLANSKDVILVAGKGHETYQILNDRTIDFDDRIEVKNALLSRQS